MKLEDVDLVTVSMSSKGDTVGDLKLMTDVESEYEESEYVSFHEVVVLHEPQDAYYRLYWDRTKEDDPEILMDSLMAAPVKRRSKIRIDWEDA